MYILPKFQLYREYVVKIILSVIAMLSVFDELVTTNDGRTIILKDDGTYKIQKVVKENWQDYVILAPGVFDKKTTEYDMQYIRYMPNFHNLSNKTITGIQFKTEFKDVFGKTIKYITGDMQQAIAPGRTSQSNIYYKFENNPFISDETYDALLPLVSASAKNKVSVSTIVFKDGEVVNF